MPMPRGLARFNRRITNRVARRFAGILPGYGILEHTGRRSGRTYRVPLNTFPVDGGFAIVVAYGEQSDWLRNVRAAGGGVLVHQRRRYTLSAPRFDPAVRLPLAGRLLRRVSRASTVLVVTAVPG